MPLFNVSFEGDIDLDLPEDVDLFDAAFRVLIELLPTATIIIEEVEEI